LIDLPPPLDPARVLVGSEQPRNALENRQQVAGPGQGRRQAEHVGEAPHEAAKLLGALDDDGDRLFEIVAVGGFEVAGVGERGMQQRVRSGNGVVHLVRHHADEFFVGRSLELAQFLGQFFDQQKTARKAAIDERAVMTLHPARPEHSHETRIPGGEAREGLGQR